MEVIESLETTMTDVMNRGGTVRLAQYTKVKAQFWNVETTEV